MNPPRLLLLVLAVTFLCAAVVGVASVASHPSRPASAASPVDDAASDAASDWASEPGQRPEVDAAFVLASWDRRRSRVWASGESRDLRALYTPDASAGRADAAMLRVWRSRGLRVRGLRTQVLALRVLRQSGRALVVRVTDRVAAGAAVRGSSSVPLPADRPSTRVIRLKWYAGGWRVASVVAG